VATTPENRAQARQGADGAGHNTDNAARLAALKRHWEFDVADQDLSHAIYHDDAVLEFPQSREWRRVYPATLRFRVRRIRGSGELWVAEISISYDGGPRRFGCSILDFRGDKVARETIYIADAWRGPEWRARWRAPWRHESLG
jgi:hypothetical protein